MDASAYVCLDESLFCMMPLGYCYRHALSVKHVGLIIVVVARCWYDRPYTLLMWFVSSKNNQGFG